MTIVKYGISLYFSQVTSIVSCFQMSYLKRFSFFEIKESSRIAILAARRCRKIVHFLVARIGQRDVIYQYALGSSQCMFCCF